MNRTKLAIVIAVAGGLSAATAHAQSRPLTPTAFEYGNYDYYSTAAAQTAQPAPAAAAPAPAPAPDSAAPAAAPGCDAAPSPRSSNGCGNTCCDCNGCCHEKLPHWLCCNCKLHPCFCWCDSCPLTCPDVTTCHLFDDCCCLKEHQTTLTGWISGGIMGNSDSPS